MATQSLSAAAPGDYTGDPNWALTGAATRWQAVALPDDDNTSYIEIARTDATKFSAVVGTKPAGLSAVNSIVGRLRGNTRDNAVSTQVVNVFARLSGSDGTASGVSGFGAAGSWFTNGSSALARPGGGPWTTADIANATLQIGIYVDPWEIPDPGFVAMTSLSLTLDFAVPIGALAYGIIGCLGAIAASGLTLDRMPAITREVYARTPYRLRIQPHEYEQAFRELREYRYPGFWFRPGLAA